MASEAARAYAAKLGLALPATPDRDSAAGSVATHSQQGASNAVCPRHHRQSVATVATDDFASGNRLATRKPAEYRDKFIPVATVTTVATQKDKAATFSMSASDSPHIAAEAALPPPGSAARQRIEQEQAKICAELIAGFQRHRGNAAHQTHT